MSKLVDVAKQLNEAWQHKNEVTVRSCLHKDYSFKGPMMEIHSAEEAVAFMNECPFQATPENCEVYVQGQTLVHVFDWKVTAPFQETIPMVEVLEFEGEKVKRARLFFDTALFPEDIKAKMLAQKAA